MKLELGEITQGAMKGFKYWYPSLEERDLQYPLTEGLLKEKDYFVFDNHVVLLNLLNTSLKQLYSEQVQNKNALGRQFNVKDKAALQMFGEHLAKTFPTGELNTREDVTLNPPWKKGVI